MRQHFFLMILLCVALAAACTKTDTFVNEVDLSLRAEALPCAAIGVAVVQRMDLNHDGSEYFFYLQVMEGEQVTAEVFPGILAARYTVPGLTLTFRYRVTQLLHRYVLCIDGETYDPESGEELTMPVVEVCSIDSGE